MSRPRFHLAFPVTDLAAARQFYGEVLGCPEGRCDDHWIDFDLYGHQIVAHLVDGPVAGQGDAAPTNAVDGDAVPVPHFGLLLDWDAFDTLAARLTAAGVAFRIAPRVRFEGQPGEQKTMFFTDPSGNALEMKAFRDDSEIFRK
jgi:extradiol dioxygenase family protein